MAPAPAFFSPTPELPVNVSSFRGEHTPPALTSPDPESSNYDPFAPSDATIIYPEDDFGYTTIAQTGVGSNRYLHTVFIAHSGVQDKSVWIADSGAHVT